MATPKIMNYPKYIIPLYGDQLVRVVNNDEEKDKVLALLYKTNAQNEVFVFDGCPIAKVDK